MGSATSTRGSWESLSMKAASSATDTSATSSLSFASLQELFEWRP